MAKTPKKTEVAKPKRAYNKKVKEAKEVKEVKGVVVPVPAHSPERLAIIRKYSNVIRRRKALAAFDRQSK